MRFLLLLMLGVSLLQAQVICPEPPATPTPQPEPCGAVYRLMPAMPGETVEPLVMRLPNSWPRDVKVVELGTGGVVAWRGLSCDQVSLPIGSKLRMVSEGANSDWLYTVEDDGHLSYVFNPVE